MILPIRRLLDAGHPTASPVEADGCRLFTFQGGKALLVRLPAAAEIVDGLDGGDFGHGGLLLLASLSAVLFLGKFLGLH